VIESSYLNSLCFSDADFGTDTSEIAMAPSLVISQWCLVRFTGRSVIMLGIPVKEQFEPEQAGH
jgi:hypothetical protein